MWYDDAIHLEGGAPVSDSNITKKALAGALKKLMSEVPFSKISVGDICETCGMSRKSFYYHFKDKYDLVNWIFYTEFIEAIDDSDLQSSYSLFGSVCRYFYRERAFYRSALKIEGQNSFSEYLREVISPLLQDVYLEVFSSDENSHFFTTFLVDALLAAVIRWLTTEPILAAEEFLDRMRTVFISIARITLKNLEDLSPDKLPEAQT